MYFILYTIAMGKEAFAKRKELLRGVLSRTLKKKNGKNVDLERDVVWSGNMDNEKRRHRKAGGI